VDEKLRRLLVVSVMPGGGGSEAFQPGVKKSSSKNAKSGVKSPSFFEDLTPDFGSKLCPKIPPKFPFWRDLRAKLTF